MSKQTRKVLKTYFKAGARPTQGKYLNLIDSNLNLEEAQKAAHLCCINIIAQLKSACNGNLDKVRNCVKITGFVNSVDDFKDQPKVINPASELISKIFEDCGKHTRAAVSTNSLPLGAAVEIDAIFEIN